VDHEIVKDLFDKTAFHTNSAKIQSLYVIRHIIERMTIENIPRSQALETSMHLKSSYPNTCVAETPDQREEDISERRVRRKTKAPEPKIVPKTETIEQQPDSTSVFTTLIRGNFNESIFLAKALNNEEEDKLRVLTIRSVETNGKSGMSIYSVFHRICF
jgi:hypothetical protein